MNDPNNPDPMDHDPELESSERLADDQTENNQDREPAIDADELTNSEKQGPPDETEAAAQEVEALDNSPELSEVHTRSSVDEPESAREEPQSEVESVEEDAPSEWSQSSEQLAGDRIPEPANAVQETPIDEPVAAVSSLEASVETVKPTRSRTQRLRSLISGFGWLLGTASRMGWSGIRGAGRQTARLKPSQPVLLVLLVLILSTSAVMTVYKYFLRDVPSGYMLVKISMFGDPLKEGQILAGPGQKGVREQVHGEGWHIVWPVLFKTELKKNFVVPGQQITDGVAEPPKVGIVKALGGTPLPPGVFMAERGQQGIWREVLLPGSYRLNPYGFEVKLVDMVEIKPGNVGVLRRKLGVNGATEFASSPNEKGIVRDRVLQPGLYPVNTEEYEVISCPIGIYQTTYHYDLDKSMNTALVFDASDSNRIELDCTIEWELRPEHWPEWVAKFRTRERIESAVIKLNVKNISRNRGQDYGAEDFLDGGKREKFQTEFTNGLSEECERDSVVVRNAFIRNIIIRDEFLAPKREEQLAKEKAETQKELTITAETNNNVVEAEQTIALEVAKVEAQTDQMVAAIEREATNLDIVTQAEAEKLKDEYAAEIAILDSQRSQLVGEAEAESTKMIDTAKSSLHKMQMDVFANDADAFFRYTMSQNLNPALRIRLFQSGPGTFWTNMGEKNFNLFAPVPGSSNRR